MKTVRYVLPIALLLLVAGVARAQAADAFFTVDGITPLEENSDFQVRTARAGGRLGVPVLNRRPDLLVLHAAYEVLLRSYFLGDELETDEGSVDSDAFIERNHLDDPLHGVSAGFAYVRSLGDRWRLFVSASVLYRGDFGRLTLDDLAYRGLLLAFVRFHDTFTLSFGAAYTDALRPLLGTPVIGWRWTPVHWFRSVARLPVHSEFIFSFLDRIETGVFHTWEGGEYRVRPNDLEVDHWGRAKVRLGCTVNFRLFSDLWLHLQGGYVPYAYFRGEDEEGKEVFEGDLEPAWFAGVRLEFRRFPFINAFADD